MNGTDSSLKLPKNGLSMDKFSEYTDDGEDLMSQYLSSRSSKLEAWFDEDPITPLPLAPHYKDGTPKQTPTGLVFHQVRVEKIFQGHQNSAGIYVWHELRTKDDEEYTLRFVQNNSNDEMFHIEHHVQAEGSTETKIVYSGVLEWSPSNDDNKNEKQDVLVVGRPFLQPHPLNKDGIKIDTGALVVIPSWEVNKELKLRRRLLAYDFNWCYCEAKELKAATREEILHLCSEWKKEEAQKS